MKNKERGIDILDNAEMHLYCAMKRGDWNGVEYHHARKELEQAQERVRQGEQVCTCDKPQKRCPVHDDFMDEEFGIE